MNVPARVAQAAHNHPHPLLFATISGAHLYGFPSADSDWDLRGCHLLGARAVLGLDDPQETIQVEQNEPGFELDLVSHDARKFFHLLLRKNGYVLEQLFSPLVVVGGDVHEELKEIAQSCITRHHVHHYLGFSRNQWDLFAKENPPRAKPLLYVYRVLLTGIHLMRSGLVEANLVHLLAEYPVAGVEDLIALKLAGAEKATLAAAAVQMHGQQVEQLTARLRDAGEASRLRDLPAGRDALSALLIRLRLASAQR